MPPVFSSAQPPTSEYPLINRYPHLWAAITSLPDTFELPSSELWEDIRNRPFFKDIVDGSGTFGEPAIFVCAHIEVMYRYPDRWSWAYVEIVTPVLRNLMFAGCMVHCGYPLVNHKTDMERLADRFKSMFGCFVLEKGLDSALQWVSVHLDSLIRGAEADWRSKHPRVDVMPGRIMLDADREMSLELKVEIIRQCRGGDGNGPHFVRAIEPLLQNATVEDLQATQSRIEELLYPDASSELTHSPLPHLVTSGAQGSTGKDESVNASGSVAGLLSSIPASMWSRFPREAPSSQEDSDVA